MYVIRYIFLSNYLLKYSTRITIINNRIKQKAPEEKANKTTTFYRIENLQFCLKASAKFENKCILMTANTRINIKGFDWHMQNQS